MATPTHAAAGCGPDVNTLAAAPADRRRPYELPAEAFGLPADRREAAVAV